MEELEQAVRSGASKADRWARVPVVRQAAESSDTPEQAKAKWTKIYSLFGARGESAQDEVFAAVNMYFLINGASPAGGYKKPIRTAGGAEVGAGEVVKVVGRQPGDLRQFLRGRLEESYLFLKHNVAIREDEALAAKAENAGISREYCWLLADWLGRDCEYFVGPEAEIYRALRTSKIANAYDKQAVALPGNDLVRESAPEAKVAARGRHHAEYNQDLF